MPSARIFQIAVRLKSSSDINWKLQFDDQKHQRHADLGQPPNFVRIGNHHQARMQPNDHTRQKVADDQWLFRQSGHHAADQSGDEDDVAWDAPILFSILSAMKNLLRKLITQAHPLQWESKQAKWKEHFIAAKYFFTKKTPWISICSVTTFKIFA